MRLVACARRSVLLCALLLLAISAPVPPAGAETAPKGATILTVTGQIAHANRARFAPFDDAFFKYHEKSFVRAYAFDRAMLEALPQTTVAAKVEGWPRAIRAAGPRLTAVLAKVGVTKGAKLRLVALDGYAVELDPSQLIDKDWIVALNVDGRPLGIGGRGPVWVLYGSGDRVATGDDEAEWVWSVFQIEVF